jgi:hypothetical protein
MTQAQKTAKAKFKQAIAYRQKTGVSLKEAFAHIYGRKVGAVKKKAATKGKLINLYSKIGDIEKYNGTILGVKIGVKKILGKNKLYDLKIYDVNGNHSIINLYAEDKESDIRNDLTPKLYKYIFNTTTQSYTSLQSDVLKKKLFTYLKLLAAELRRLNKKPIKKTIPKKKVAKKVVKKKVTKKVSKKKLTRLDYDKRYQAKKPGKRKSASGNTYYESRPNRSDKGKLLGIKNESKILDDYKTILGKVSYYQNTIQMYRDAIKNYKTRGISPAQLLNLKLWIKTHSKLLSEYKIHAKQLKKLI